MQTRYHTLRGMKVISADGHDLGRVTDLRAERRGEALCVTALMTGKGGSIQRIAFSHGRFFGALSPVHIPWTAVNRIEEAIHLSLTREQVQALPPMEDGERQDAEARG